MKLIAICGPAGSGKSTLARHYFSHLGYQVKAFAEPIKEMLRTFLKYQALDDAMIDRMLYLDLKETPSEYFRGKTPRHALQTLGTEWGRDLIDPKLWVTAWEHSIQGKDRVLVDDLRFLSEAQKIKDLGGYIIKLSREGVSSGTHPSEREYLLIQEDLHIDNSGAMDFMFRRVAQGMGDRL